MKRPLVVVALAALAAAGFSLAGSIGGGSIGSGGGGPNTITGNLTVSGSADVTDNLTVGGQASIRDGITASGPISAPDFDGGTFHGTDLAMTGTASADTVNANTVDAGEVISPKHCVGATCAANFTLSGATVVANTTVQAPTVTCTGFCQSLGAFGNTGGAGDCPGALSSMCVNDPQGLAVSNGATTTITMATDGGGSAIFSGSLSTPLTDAGVLQLRTTTGNPTCGIGDAGLNDPNIGQHRFQPSTGTEGTDWLCSGRGWIPYPTPFALSASFTSAASINDFWISPPLVAPSGSPGPGGALSGCSLIVTAAGSGGAGVTFSAEWHDGDGGAAKRLCQIDLLCSAPAETEILKPACDGDAGWGPSFGGTGFVALMRDEDGGTCGGFPSGSMACSYQFFTNTLPF